MAYPPDAIHRCACDHSTAGDEGSCCELNSRHCCCDLDSRPAASAPSTESRDEPGAACTCSFYGGSGCECFPANDRCPSAARCTKGHVTLESGMVRSNDQGKPDYTLLDLTMLERWARHMTEQVPSKGRDNWRKASTPADLQRFLESGWRHFLAWQSDLTDEDHAAALMFNITGAEHVRRQL